MAAQCRFRPWAWGAHRSSCRRCRAHGGLARPVQPSPWASWATGGWGTASGGFATAPRPTTGACTSICPRYRYGSWRRSTRVCTVHCFRNRNIGWNMVHLGKLDGSGEKPPGVWQDRKYWFGSFFFELWIKTGWEVKVKILTNSISKFANQH